MKKYLIPLVSLGISMLAQTAFATVSIPKPNGIAIPSGPVTATGDVTSLFCGLLNWVFWGLIVLAIIMIFVAGFHYVTSAGEADKISKANKTLLYAVVAILVAFVAQGVPFIVSSFISGKYADVCSASSASRASGTNYSSLGNATTN